MRAWGRIACLAAGFALIVAYASSALAQIALVDDLGGNVRIEAPAQRIVSLAPNLTEMVFAAGAGERLIATVRGADYPSAAAGLPVVGDAAGVDLERIYRLRPDLVLAWGSGNRRSDIDRLARKGFTVAVLEARSLTDVPRHLRMIGRLAGSEQTAGLAAASFERGLDRLSATYGHACTVGVFVEIWHQPVFTVGPDHAVSDALRVCAARNVLHEYPALAGPVPLENVVAANADVILSLTGEPPSAAQSRWNNALPGSARPQLPVVSIAPDLLVRSGPRMLTGIGRLCEQLAAMRSRVCEAGRPER